MLEEFVRDTHKAAEGEAALEAALKLAAEGSMESVTAAFEEQVRSPMRGLLGGELLRSMLVMMQQLRLLMEEEVEAIDSLLKRNDFNLQVMATIPGLFLIASLLLGLRHFWRKFRSADRALRDPIEAMQMQVNMIDSLLTRAEWPEEKTPKFQAGERSQYEATPMELSEVGELVFRVQKLRSLGSYWLRGSFRTEVLYDTQLLLDSGRLSASQRARVAETIQRRLDNVNAFMDHW